jgi:hypothetical protein
MQARERTLLLLYYMVREKASGKIFLFIAMKTFCSVAQTFRVESQFSHGIPDRLPGVKTRQAGKKAIRP